MSAADAIIELYDRRARDWDADRGRDLFERPWLDRFAALLPAGGSVLDIGCGAGDPIARHFLNAGYEVTGVDSGANMIGICREKFPAQDWPKSAWDVADMRNFCLGKAFDGILAWHSMFHLTPEDQPDMFHVFRKHARAGTALMFTSGMFRGGHVGEWRGEPLYHGSLDGEDYRTLLNENGFDLVHHVAGDPDCGNANIWLCRAR